MEDQCSVLSERMLQGAQSRGLSAAALVQSSDTVGDASGACPNWAAISASPEMTTTKYPSVTEKSGTSRAWGLSHQRAAPSPGCWTIGIRPCAFPSGGYDKAQSGLVLRRGTQVIPGSSLCAHVSPTSRCNRSSVGPPPPSPLLTPPGVTQEAAEVPPRAKDPPTGLTTRERYREVLTLPLDGMFSCRAGRPETIGVSKESSRVEFEGGEPEER